MRRPFPIYRQLDSTDCGATALQMVAKYYGKFYPPYYLRKLTGTSREGVSMLSISDSAEKLGFRTVGLKITVQRLLDEVPLPCIVHWNHGHFVVVFRIKRNKIFIADPAVGKISYTTEEFAKYWVSSKSGKEGEGIVLLLEPTLAFYERFQDLHEKRGKRNGLISLVEYLIPYQRFIAQLIVGLLAASIIQLSLPFLTQSIVDVGINTQNVKFIYLVLAGQMMLFIGRTTIDFIRRWILLHLSTRVSISIVSDFLSKLFKLPMSFFEGNLIGDILRRIEDHARVERFISTSTLNIFFSLFNVVIFGSILAIYNKVIFLIFFFFSLAYVVFVLFFMKKRSEFDYKKFHQLSDNQTNLIQSIQGMAEIKLNNCETKKRWEWERIQAKLFHLNVAGTKLQQYQDAGSLFINESKNILITVVAAITVVEGGMTLGTMLAIQFIIGQLNVPIGDFINFVRDMQDAKLSISRIQEIQVMENEEQKLTSLHSTFNFNQKLIVLKDVSFNYEGQKSSPVLDKINLTIPEGKITAIVGASGSGKSTLMKLLFKFYEPLSGCITVGGMDFRSISARDWRAKCGAVLQEGTIFNDTIASNICMTDDDIDSDRLYHAAEVAQLGDLIKSKSLGFNTRIGLNGMGLSQGQKQRILIARAVYKDPQLLFFDEATSALDTNNEKIIMQNLERFYKGRTVVVAAHRLSTVRNADQIIVLEKGKVIELGTHHNLIERRGKYFELISNQLELNISVN